MTPAAAPPAQPDAKPPPKRTVKKLLARVARVLLEIPPWVERRKRALRICGLLATTFALGFGAGRWTLPLRGQISGAQELGAGRYDVQGTVTGWAGGAHLWVAIQADNLTWPKYALPVERPSLLRALVEPEVTRAWGVRVEEGRTDPFFVLLLALDGGAQARVEEWLRRGQELRSFTGFTGTIPGARTLAIAAVHPGPRISLGTSLDGVDRQRAPHVVPARLSVANAAQLHPYLVVEEKGVATVQPDLDQTDAGVFEGSWTLGEPDVTADRSYLLYAVLARSRQEALCPRAAGGSAAARVLDPNDVVVRSEPIRLRRAARGVPGTPP